MRKFTSFLLSIVIVAGLSACTNEQGEFDALISRAELSLDAGDYDTALTLVDEAFAILPNSEVAEEVLSRVQGEMNEATLETFKLQASSESWADAFATMGGLLSDAPRLKEAKAALQSNFEMAMVRFQGRSADIEYGEGLLATMPLFAMRDISLDKELVEAVYLLALTQTLNRLAGAIKAGPDQAIAQLNAELAKGLYRDEGELEAIKEKILVSYETQVVNQSKQLVRSKDFIGAQALLAVAASRAPRRAAIEEETLRVEAAASVAEAEAKKRVLSAMRMNEDTFENIKWYNDRNQNPNPSDKVYLYMGQRDGAAPFLRLVFMMRDDSWHFFTSIVIDVDGEKFNYEPGYSGVTRDNSTEIWEYYDREPTTRDFDMLDKIIASTSTRIRYVNDDNFYTERTVTSAQKKGLSNVLLAFEALGGAR